MTVEEAIHELEIDHAVGDKIRAEAVFIAIQALRDKAALEEQNQALLEDLGACDDSECSWLHEAREGIAQRDKVIVGLHRNLEARDQHIRELEQLLQEKQKVQATAQDVMCTRPHLKRRKLPDERPSKTIKLRIGTEERICPVCKQGLPGNRCSFYVQPGFYEDGTLAELFIRLDRFDKGDRTATFADTLAISTSVSCQHGVPIEPLLLKMRYVKDESGGVPMVWSDEKQDYVPHPLFHHVGSIVDYVAAAMERVLVGKPATALTAEERAEQERAQGGG